MGKVMTRLKLTNPEDVAAARRRAIRRRAVRTVEVEALVDTGATMLAIPADVARRLGVRELGRRRVRYADGRTRSVPLVGPILVEICGRRMHCDALVEATGTQPLVGQIPLEGLDLVVDPRTREARANPESPDEPLMDLMAAG